MQKFCFMWDIRLHSILTQCNETQPLNYTYNEIKQLGCATNRMLDYQICFYNKKKHKCSCEIFIEAVMISM